VRLKRAKGRDVGDRMKMFDSIADDLIRQKNKERAEKLRAEKAEAEKAEAEKARVSDLEVYTTTPIIPIRKETRGRKPLPRIICPFCENERKQNGVKLHIEDAHGVPGVAVQDLLDVQNGVKSLEDLVYEKFDDDAEIDLRNLSPRVSKEVFGSWEDVEAEADPIDRKAEADPVNQKVEADNPGRKVERRKFNWIPFFSPFNRRRFKK